MFYLALASFTVSHHKGISFYRYIISCTIMITFSTCIILQEIIYLQTTKRTLFDIKCLSSITFLPICVGMVSYTVKSTPASSVQSVHVAILDREGRSVGESGQSQGQITVHNAKLWWPYSMVTSANETAYLYTFKVR